MSTETDAALAGGSYEVIHARLLASARILESRASSLNEQRITEFGGQALTVLAAARFRTEHSCVPRDVVPLGGDLLLAGTNVVLGLKQERAVSDVFSLFQLGEGEGGVTFTALPPSAGGGFLEDRRFIKDLEELYRFYKDARLVALSRNEARVFAVFQTGLALRDRKVLRFSVDTSGRVTYLDNRGEAELARPPSHDFGWTRAGRDRFVDGRHPHVNILDEVFIETVGGDLTVKVENSTEDGRGIYREPVEEKSQSLDDAEFWYARVGALILLRVLPYRESVYRHLVFNTRTQEVVRADAIGTACVTLPEDQGVVFPGGYILQTGEVKQFDGHGGGLTLDRVVKSPNGEDALYAFTDEQAGTYLLLAYNQVKKEVASPITGHGYAIFPDGRLVVLKVATDEPTRVHPVQVWQTPYVSAEFAAARPPSTTSLGRLGNAELVRGISEVLSLVRLARAERPTRRSFEALSASCQRVLDRFHWLAEPSIALAPAVAELATGAEQIVDEFEKVVAMRRGATEALERARDAHRALLADTASAEALPTADAYMSALGTLRRHRGSLISLKEVKYIDVAALDAMDAEVAARFDEVSGWCVRFLLTPAALAPLDEGVAAVDRALPAVTRTAQLEPKVTEVERLAEGLGLLGEVVGGLTRGDPVEKATILDAVSAVFARLNRTRALVLARKKELTRAEKQGEFASQFRLFSQSIDSALALATTPAQCDEQQARLLVQLEELESRFADLDEFAAELAQRREDLLSALGARKQGLLDERQRRARHLFEAGERILASVGRRASSFGSDDELNSYFSADPMVQKLVQLAAQLVELDDTVKADELESRLKAARQDALRTLRDRLELFEGGQAVVRLGAHRFTVNTQPLEPTVLPRDGALTLHLTGSDYFERLDDAEIEAARELWAQTRPSESPEVYRGEYLAHLVLELAEAGGEGLSVALLHEAQRDGTLVKLVERIAQPRYDDGYERGVHDADAAAILATVLRLKEGAGRLRYPAAARVLAALFHASWEDRAARTEWERRAASLVRLRRRYPSSGAEDALAAELAGPLHEFARRHGLSAPGATVALAARALLEELGDTPVRLVTTRDAVALTDELLDALDRSGERLAFEDELRASSAGAPGRYTLARHWLTAHARAVRVPEGVVSEAALLLAVDGASLPREVSAASLTASVPGLLGQHPRIVDQVMELGLDDFLARLADFRTERAPRYARYRATVHRRLEDARARLRLDELKPRVLSSFVRNRLIDQVYLPLIGTNLAKQLGATGANRRTDTMGLLLLVSPPGYGKTTLMEYVAARLGLTFVKVNGPSLGHQVKSLDPQEAPNATARQEVERTNFAFELGNNVMLYIDDIQHTSAEFLQKFISLCDGTRKIEGIWNGRTRTYDLRGKKFCVVMAGNPYTESGERFRIPDMLANRADTYNLGDVAAGQEALFASSYIENALTSNPVTAPLLTRPARDVHRIIDMAASGEVSATELEHGYTAAELAEIVGVVQRLLRVQATLLTVNQAYIRSASQDDRFRTEPPFKLQGSYRNMNKLAEKVVAAMTDAELEALVDAHYQSESQTLTSAAEANLLKLAELRGRLDPAGKARWEELRRSFRRLQSQGGADDDPVVRVTGSIGALQDELGQLGAVVAAAARERNGEPSVDARLTEIAAALNAPRTELAEALARLASSMQAMAASRSPSDEVVERLARLADRPPSVGAELAPLMDRMAAAVEQALSRTPASPAELSQVVERLAQSSAEPDGVLREEMAHQMLLIQERLHELAAAARSALQADPDGSMKAMMVWQQAREAIELLRALPSRGRRRAPPQG